MGGWRSMVINTQERAVSTDINRLQRFKEQDLAELFRHMFNTSVSSADDQLGIVSEPTTLETPLRAEIVGNGFLVKPQAASLNLLVDGGVVFMLAPDAMPDESNYKFIRDPGVLIAGTLTMTANAAGSTRIDMIECRINPTPSTVTDSRDIYNETTGLFNATSVTKEMSGRLEYRVRAGTAGAGMPALAEGWLPLAVASVPNGSTSVDTMTFWDVRPLISDRANGPFMLPMIPRIHECHLQLNQLDYVGAARLTGYVQAELNGRRLGGVMRRGSPGTDADYVVLEDAANQMAGFTASASTTLNVYVYLATPGGLPRWARYTDGPSGRVPRAPCGIPVVTQIAPDVYGRPSSAITMPAGTGLTLSTTSAVCILAGVTADSVIQDGMSDGRMWFYRTSSAGENPLQVAGTIGSTYENFVLTAGTHFPANAKKLRVTFRFRAFVTAGDQIQFNQGVDTDLIVRFPNSGLGEWRMEAFGLHDLINTFGSDTSVETYVHLEIPLPSPFPVTAWPGTVALAVNVGSQFTGATGPQATLYVHGWEF